MTRKRYDDKDTEFGKWMRLHPKLDSVRKGYDSENLDYIWHHYFDGKLLLLEEKCYRAVPKMAQLDTHHVIDQFCSTGKAKNRRGHKIIYYGYYILQFERESPVDGWMWLNGHVITEAELLRFLQFDPETLRRFPRKTRF